MRAAGSAYGVLGAAFFAFFLTWSFSFSMLPIWLSQSVGLDGHSTGIIFSANAVAALIVMPCYGYFQDRFGLGKHLLYLVGAALVLSGPFFAWVYAPLLATNLVIAALAGGLFFAIAFLAGVGALEAYVERVSRTVGFEFGKARMWGSLGWATATFFAGRTFNIAPQINFWMASLSGVVFLLLIALARPPERFPERRETGRGRAFPDPMETGNAPFPEGQPSHGDASGSDVLHPAKLLALLASGRFWALAIFVMGVSCIYSVYDQQFPVYFASIFPTREVGNAMYGYLNALQVFLEAWGMFLAPRLVNRIGAKNGLILSGIIMAVRMTGSGLADGPLEISVMKLLHAAELPIMIIALFKYIAATFDPKLSATLYLVGYQFMMQLAASALSVIAGNMYDRYGFAQSYLMLGSIVAMFVAISCFLLTDDGQPPDRVRKRKGRLQVPVGGAGALISRAVLH